MEVLRGPDRRKARAGFLLAALCLVASCSLESASSGPGWQLEDDRDSATYIDRDAYRDATPDTSDPDAANLDVGGRVDSRDASDSGEAEVVPVAVAAGRNTCVTYSNGRIKCAGDNEFGAFGEGVERGDVYEPVTITGVEGVDEVASYSSHSCANLVDGELKCWGENASYQLTDVAPPESGTPPTTIPEMSEVYEVAAGDNFTCARQTGRRVECWGDNARGQLGNDRGGEDGSEAVSARPTLVSGLANVIDIDAGRATACARDLDGRVFCWGDNSYGQVRRHTSDYQRAYEPAPIESEFVGVYGFERAAGLCVGEGHVCAIEHRSGAVTCWGRNTEGAVGEHSYEEWDLDTKMLDAVTVTCGAHFTCALLEDGQVRCWGSNSHGQLGRANFPNVVQKSHRDLPAEGLHDVVALDAGEAHVCAVQSEGTVWCWGANDHGQLGDGTNEYKRAPVETLF